MSGIIWEDPPQSRSGPRPDEDMVAWVEVVKSVPGKWARYLVGKDDTHPTSTPTKLRRHGLTTKTSTLDARGNKISGGRIRVWAKWDPPESCQEVVP